MKVKVATFTTSGRLMRNKESTLPGLNCIGLQIYETDLTLY